MLGWFTLMPIRRRFSVESAPKALQPRCQAGGGGLDTLGRRLLKLVFAKRSAIVAIHKWAEEGKPIQKYQLNRVVRELRSYKRYKHALEICEWMTTQKDLRLQPGDYAVHLDLIGKVRGLSSAEKFFEDLPTRMIEQATCSSLLHCYVQHNLVSKAEALLKKMSECGYLNHPLPYNCMIALYLSNSLSDKVHPLVQELEKTTLPDIFTYNLILRVCANKNDVVGAEKILLQLKMRKLEGDWVTYSTLTSIYSNAGQLKKARDTLKEMEIRVSRSKRVAFASLITLYANLLDKEGVLNIWKRMKSTFRKMNDAEYMCIIASLVKLGDVKKAEDIYADWVSVSGTKDTRIPNILLQVYCEEDSMERAEKFHDVMGQKGFFSTYVTWETLALGYLSKKRMDKVLECLKKAFSSLKQWIPNEKLVREIFNELERMSDITGAETFLAILQGAGYTTTEMYNSLLRTYEKSGKMPLLIVERMKKDKVELDHETHRLLNVTSKLCVSDASSHFS